MGASATDHDGQDTARPPSTGWLGPLPDPATDPDVAALHQGDVDEVGYVMNLSRVWAFLPRVNDGLFGLLRECAVASGLSLRQRAVLVVAAASARADAYCSLAWGAHLAAATSDAAAAGVVRADDGLLDPTDRVLARWARRVASDPNGCGATDVQELRDAGFTEAQIFAITTFVALRVAFSTVNAALGARPDHQLGAAAPPTLLGAVAFGRPVAEPPPPV